MPDSKEGFRSRFFAELTVQLQREGFAVAGDPQDPLRHVLRDGRQAAVVNGAGQIRYLPEHRKDPHLMKQIDQISDIAKTTHEYMALLEKAPPLEASGLAEGYSVLADFNDTVLAAHPTSRGVEFITWDWDYDHKGVSHGHYYDSYPGAKQDFATRAGLVPRAMLFSPGQLAEVYRCASETLDADRPISEGREKGLRDIMAQIERAVPGLPTLSVRKEQDHAAQWQGAMGGLE